MASSCMPQRIKRAKQQITVKLYQDQLAMLDKYGRFIIDDSRDYIISQALELVFKRDKEVTPLGRAGQKCWERCGNAPSSALVRHHSLDHSRMREESVLAQKSWARCKTESAHASGGLTEAGRVDVRAGFAQSCGDVCEASVTKVKQLRMTAHPELLKALRSSEILIHRGWKWSKESPENQIEALRLYRGYRGIGETIRHFRSSRCSWNDPARS